MTRQEDRANRRLDWLIPLIANEETMGHMPAGRELEGSED